MKKKTPKPKSSLAVWLPETFTVVKKVIDKIDPESLLKLGAPKDEYDPVSLEAARTIVREGGGKLSITELANILAFSLHHSFNMWSRPVVLHMCHFDMARELKPQLGERPSYVGKDARENIEPYEKPISI